MNIQLFKIIILTQIFGHTKLSILDGGIPKWISNGYPTVEGPQGNVSPVSYTPTFNPAILRNIEQVKAAFDAKNEQVCYIVGILSKKNGCYNF